MFGGGLGLHLPVTLISSVSAYDSSPRPLEKAREVSDLVVEAVVYSVLALV